MSDSLTLRPYTHTDAATWDTLVSASKNATFLHFRGYMDYHSDRFTDASLFVERRGKPVALFAASRSGATVTAHGGLTYGGLLMPFNGFDGADALEAMRLITGHYRQEGAMKLVCKPVPAIYHRNPADEEVYALWRCGARMSGCGLSSTIDLSAPCRFNENTRRNCRKAAREGITTGAADNSLDAFWQILSQVLDERHGVRPVHSLDEIKLLKSRFPENIRLFGAHNPDGEIVAGTLMFFAGPTAHAQYIAASTEGRASGALAALFAHIAEHECDGRRYLDFGISTEEGGAILNEGLHHQKYGMGGRGTVYPAFTIDL